MIYLCYTNLKIYKSIVHHTDMSWGVATVKTNFKTFFKQQHSCKYHLPSLHCNSALALKAMHARH